MRLSISKKLQLVLWHSFDCSGLDLGYIISGFPTSLFMFFSLYQRLKKTWLFTKKEFKYLWRQITWKQLIFLWFSVSRQHEPTPKVLKRSCNTPVTLRHSFAKTVLMSRPWGSFFFPLNFPSYLTFKLITSVNLIWWLITIACLR